MYHFMLQGLFEKYTFYLITNNQPLSNIVDKIKEYSIKNVKSITYLGVEIDQHLKWDDHI